MKLTVYPGSTETEVFVRFASLLKDYGEVVLTGPNGWGSPVPGTGTDFLPSFEEELPTCDSVLFIETEPLLQRSVYEEKIRAAVGAGKKVYLDLGPRLADLDIPYERVHILEDSHYESKTTDATEAYPVYEIPVPVIFVVGLGPNTGKFHVQLALRKSFLNKNYSVSQIGSKRASCLFGFTPFPDIFEDNSLSFHHKIVAFNRYVYQKCMRERPDVMIIGLPGGMLPVNSILFKELGVKTFLAAQAVRPDTVVLCNYAHPFNQEYFDELSKMCKYRLNFNLKYVAVSTTDVSLSPDSHKSEYTYLSPEFVEEKYITAKKYGAVGLYSVFSEQDMNLLGKDILQELRDNF